MLAKTSSTAGAYELLERIGAGGMGEVWRARHARLGQPAAVKLIAAGVVAGERQRARFELEARTTAQLGSQHTVRLFDCGVDETGRLYYAMELLEGIDLRALVERFGAVSAARTIHFLLQACSALAEAHDRGVVHRDVKPANLFACRTVETVDFIKVVDFGLVRAIGCDRDEPSTPERVAGTPAFLPPEVILSECTGECHVDGRADIYALGCVGYWLLTGQPPFAARDATEMATAHATVAPQPPSALAEHDVPEALDAVLLACLAKDCNERPQTAKELRRRLREVPAATWTEEHARRWWRVHLPGSARG